LNTDAKALSDFRPRRQAANFIEAAAAIRDAKMDLLMVGDRHAVPINAFSPIPLIARLMAVTGGLPVGCLFLAPFYNPIVLAEQIGTLASFTDAPFTAAFAIGDTEAQFSAFAMALKSRTVRTDEVVEIVRRLLAGERLSFDGRYHRLADVAIGPLPETPVPIWIGGRRGGAVERAGKLGDAWITDTRATDEELAVEMERYRRVAGEHGRVPKAVLRRNVFVGESDADAERVVTRILESSYRGLTPERVLYGGPERIVSELLRYEEMGFELAIVRHLAGDHDLMMASVAHIGEAVMPALHANSTARDDG
jgi:alkanesulfonate monooxygenase SsuD/methylene tetrahydromethanopterin reductase-like flavin-dependent oxidoreductase (luciferase family)